jgi:acetylornithine deacetylase/succinyl-diaminopimelate desuccinylase-like protein
LFNLKNTKRRDVRVNKTVLGISLGLALLGQPVPAGEREAIEAYVSQHQGRIFSELVQLLSIPNVAADRSNIRRNAEHLRGMLERRGLVAEILETAGNPLVYGEKKIAGAARTILFYIHYDGQPVDAPRWKQSSPFVPVLRSARLEDGGKEMPIDSSLSRFQPEWRIYARSASDDKSPIVALCAALDALKSGGREPSSNIRVVLDGEEEAGSPSLTDVMLILDGPMHPSGRPTLNFGARGSAVLELTVYGPKFPLHSGHYGNWVPNPAMRLAQLLASMKNDAGRVLVPGFYDGIPKLKPEEIRIQEAVPDDLEELKRFFGIAQPDSVGKNLQEALQYPSLNIRGLRSAYVGDDARTIIPSDATAAIDIRLVKETPSEQTIEKVVAHIRKQGYHVVESEPDDQIRLKHSKIVRISRRKPTEAYRTEMNLPISQAITKALERTWGTEPVRIRTSGGTIPISQFIRVLGFPAISVPMVNFDNNQHSENENLRLGHLWKGIVTMASLLTMETK